MGLVAELRTVLGDAGVLTDPDVTRTYSRDMMPLAPSGQPLAVVLPESREQVQAVVRACAAASTPIVPRGAGSGLAGGANAVDGGVVLVTTKLDRIIEMDADNRLAVVEPGVVNDDLRRAAGKHDLYYPPDPSSSDWCTIGGNVATNAGGLCCVKYGVTADFVLGLEVVLADGELLRTGRRTVKGVAGYDLTSLFVGSEGTLGVITQATLALRPAPQAPATIVATFATTAAAGRAVTNVVRRGLTPSLLEIMDRQSVRAVEAYLHTDLDADGALLLAQSDSGDAAEADVLRQVFADAGATLTHATTDLDEGRTLLAARRAVPPALERLGPALTDDVCVPRSRIAEFIDGCERIREECGLVIAVFGHAGDGNMHPKIIYAEDDVPRARAAFAAILELALSLGGTITGEHGVGRLKQEWLARELGPVGVRTHHAIKAALDPAGLFNPGAALPRERSS
ncbi:FAD-binding oxidoreductase [Nocardioides speluncae]|uniref:FAD-binding oxidoreductase n=1 Tax=Nocardioides speluncae TaxID=2670337 RepID=UPI001F0B7C86|nr:FAD-linked oxidase C-terminal domain-containing protein [Nocardioides speluncae]